MKPELPKPPKPSDKESMALRLAKPTEPKTTNDHGLTAGGVGATALGGSEILHGAITSGGLHAFTGAMLGRGASAVVKELSGASIPPSTKRALGELLAKPPHEAAAELRRIDRAPKKVPLSKTTLGKVGANVSRGVTAATAQGVTNALRGVPQQGEQ